MIARLLVVWLLLAPVAALAQASTDKEFISTILAERDRQYGQRFDAQEKAVAAALAAAKEAVTKAENSAEKRFDSVNEFRNTLKDQQATLISRNEAEVRFKSLEEKIVALTARQNQATGSGEGAAQLWGYIVGAIGIAVSLGMLLDRLLHNPTR